MPGGGGGGGVEIPRHFLPQKPGLAAA